MTPEEELKALNRTIRQFESVYKSTKDPYQRARVTEELKKLKTYRDKLQSFHEFDPAAFEEPAMVDEWEGLSYLKTILERIGKKSKSRKESYDDSFGDRELTYLFHYLNFFEEDFLPILSETKLKLDFKHSLERDSFYHRFENLRRLFEEVNEDSSTVDLYSGQKHEEDMRKRSFKKKRNVIVEADKFLRSVARFAGVLVTDIEAGGLVCLNADDTLHFDRIEGRRFFEGKKVKEALMELKAFAREVIEFLNVPQIESRE
ncbi:MAG: hypothetical protein JSV89_15205 [Spirochaetaceae bacterium]|nr:MAG: hypothetical protein JSV89_15205 [Spirochaetaceae bacterium]